MEFFKQWTFKIASTIIFASLCEIIVPNGNIKKYVNLLLGFLLSLSILSSVNGAKAGDIYDIFTTSKQEEAYITQSSFEEEEKKIVLDLYTKKLEEKIKEELLNEINEEISVSIDVYSDELKFGEIKNAYITVVQQDGFIDYRQDILRILNNKFNVSESKIKIKFKNV